MSEGAVNQKTPLLNKKPPASHRPSYRRRRSSFDAPSYNSAGRNLSFKGQKKEIEESISIPGLNLLQLLTLTVCMAGVQFTWTVELSYGTPYLLSLDLSKELTALVWLAGPLSGLLVQPLIGAFSDKCTSKLGKRRPFIIGAGILTCLSMIGVAYAREIGKFCAHLFAKPDTNLDTAAHTGAIVVAVASFYFLDFTLNAVQAICRALILDIPPLWQQDLANAWSARMSNTAMVVGYFVGFVDLVKYVPWLGDSQVKVFCMVSIFVFIGTLAITCLTTTEKVNEKTDEDENEPWYSTFYYILRAFRFLPRPIQTLCNTQFFAWMGWFPFLFYSTQWVSDIYFATHVPESPDTPIDWAQGTRAGSFALLCYSVVSVLAGLAIPALAVKFNKVKWFSLLNIYTLSHLTVAVALISTFFVDTVREATVVLAIMGIPWAIVLWVPFSLVGEYVSYEDEKRQKVIEQTGVNPLDQNSPSYAAVAASGSNTNLEERQTSSDLDEFDAGMILGVHNMYVVFPQFAVAIISSFIFAAGDALKEGEDSEKILSSVTPVLVFGGLMAVVAAAFSRFIVRVPTFA